MLNVQCSVLKNIQHTHQIRQHQSYIRTLAVNFVSTFLFCLIAVERTTKTKLKLNTQASVFAATQTKAFGAISLLQLAASVYVLHCRKHPLCSNKYLQPQLPSVISMTVQVACFQRATGRQGSCGFFRCLPLLHIDSDTYKGPLCTSAVHRFYRLPFSVYRCRTETMTYKGPLSTFTVHRFYRLPFSVYRCRTGTMTYKGPLSTFTVHRLPFSVYTCRTETMTYKGPLSTFTVSTIYCLPLPHRDNDVQRILVYLLTNLG